jgi:hypothetical protein
MKKSRGKSRKSVQKTASSNIAEFHHGKRYEQIKRSHGKAVADRVAVAAGFNAARGGKKKRRR